MKIFCGSIQKNFFLKLLTFWLLIVMAHLTASVRAAVEIDDRWFPDFVDVKIVSNGMSANGIHMQVWELRSDRSVKSTLEYYQQLWKFEPGYLCYAANIWRVAGFIEQNQFITVQLLQGQVDSFGYFTISSYPESEPDINRKSSLNLPANSAILSEIFAEDGAHISRTVVFKNDLDFKSNTDFFRSHFNAKGWVEDGVPNQSPGNLIMLFRKGADSATISVNGAGASVTGVGVVVEH